MRFEFATSNRIIFGPGVISEVPALAVTLGQRVFIVTDSLERSMGLRDGLLALGVAVEFFLVKKEPDLDSVLVAIRNIQEFSAQLIISLGGGSTLDTGKAAAVLATNPGNPHDYLEVVGSGLPLQNPSIATIAIPTTAGTGSEVTRNAVINLPENRIKVSLRSPLLLPRVALVDPALTRDLPPAITASTGLDALTQLIEPFVSSKANPMTAPMTGSLIFTFGSQYLIEDCANPEKSVGRR